MTDEKTNLSIGEKLRLLGYGWRLVYKMTPSYLPFTALRSLFTALSPMLVLFFSARILNELDGARDLRTIITYVSLTVGLSFIVSVLKSLCVREVETYSAWERVYVRLQLIQAEQFTRIDYIYAEDAKISEALARMDMQEVSNGLGLLNMFYYSVPLTENIFTLVFAIPLFAGAVSGGGIPGLPVLALFGLFVLGMLLSVWYNRREESVLEKVFVGNAKANTIANHYSEYIKPDQAAKDVRLYDQGPALLKIFRSSFSAKAWIPYFFFNSRHQGFSLGVLAVLSGGFYMLAGYGALGGTVPVGSIVQSVGSMLALAGAAGTLVNTLGKLWNNASFIKPVRDFMTLPDILVKGTRPVPPPDGRDYSIEFRGVSFKYPGADTYALQNLDLKLTPGERLAVVGLNGSGKTTMIKLLCRLYDPTEGEILLDGVNIKEYDYTQYIALFSVVFQDYIIFPLRLGQNVAVSEAYDAKRVDACLDGAGFSQRAGRMPNGADTMLYKSFDEDGIQISGGEAQKIALARALFRDAPVVVLDEPTAALDPIAEYEVYTTFDKTIGGKTAVFISHRLSSCRFCNRVAVFDGGRLLQLGTHDGLLGDAGGRYYELWEAQASHYRDEEGA